MLKRTFIAQPITIPESLMLETERIRRSLNGLNVKWIEMHNLHLTLTFLGDSGVEQIEEVKSGLSSIIKNYNIYNIRIKGAGAFKSLINPQVIWIGVEADPALKYLYQDIQNLAGNLGFNRDNRPFKPHLTIGRVKTHSADHNLKDVIQAYGPNINENILAETVVYYESNLSPSGPVYKPIQTYKLGDS